MLELWFLKNKWWFLFLKNQHGLLKKFYRRHRLDFFNCFLFKDYPWIYTIFSERLLGIKKESVLYTLVDLWSFRRKNLLKRLEWWFLINYKDFLKNFFRMHRLDLFNHFLLKDYPSTFTIFSERLLGIKKNLCSIRQSILGHSEEKMI